MSRPDVCGGPLGKSSIGLKSYGSVKDLGYFGNGASPLSRSDLSMKEAVSRFQCLVDDAVMVYVYASGRRCYNKTLFVRVVGALLWVI